MKCGGLDEGVPAPFGKIKGYQVDGARELGQLIEGREYAGRVHQLHSAGEPGHFMKFHLKLIISNNRKVQPTVWARGSSQL